MSLRDLFARMARGYRIVATMLRLVIRQTRERRDLIHRLQSKYGNRRQVVEFRVTDVNFTAYLRMGDGQIELLTEKPDAVPFRMETDLETLLDVGEGKRRVMDPATGQETFIAFTPYDAWRMGRIRTYGAQATNNAALFFSEIWNEVFPEVQRELRKVIAEP